MVQDNAATMATVKTHRRSAPAYAHTDMFSLILETLVEEMQRVIDKNTSVDAMDVDRSCTLTDAVLRLASCCRETHRCLKGHATFRLYAAFIYHASISHRPPNHPTQAGIVSRFYDGMFSLSVLTGCAGRGPHVNPHRFDALSVKDVVQDRFKTSRKLCELDATQLESRCGKYMPTDIYRVGLRVAAFIGRARLLAQRVRTTTPGALCRCEFALCNRDMLDMNRRGPSSNASLDDVFGIHGSPASQHEDSFDVSDDDTDEADGHAASTSCVTYWTSVCPGVLARVPVRRFCSHSCSLRYGEELRKILPVSASDVEAHDAANIPHSKLGLPRVAAASRASFKRNMAISRTIRNASRRRGTHPSTEQDLARRIFSNITDMLNIDLAILYAAACIAESPAASVSRVLPGTHADWRREHRKWTRAIEVAKGIYLQHGPRHRTLACDESRIPAWLSKVQNSATTMFPVQPVL